MKNIPSVKDLVQVNAFLFDIDVLNGAMIGELARRNVAKHSKTVQLSRYSSHKSFVSIINALFKTYRCPSCGLFIIDVKNLERHLTSCKERFKHTFLINFCQLREKLLQKLNLFGNFYTDNEKTL